MIGWLSGIARVRTEDRVVVDVSGVGYVVTLALGAGAHVGIGEALELHVHTHVREGIFALFGFETTEELAAFETLITVTGVGPKLAMAIIGSLSPDHLSLYSLTIEKDTPFAQWVARGDLPPPDDDLAADMYELAEEMLEKAGYLHYEISNWARGVILKAQCSKFSSQFTIRHSPFVCQHNLVYWRNGAYLGVGAGAHSSWDGRRWHNLLSPQDYVARMAGGGGGEAPWESPVTAEVEVIDEALAMGETMMLGLRLLEEGVSLARFAARSGRSLPDVYRDELAALQAEGLLEQRPDRVRLTQRGRLLGNQVFARFLPGA